MTTLKLIRDKYSETTTLGELTLDGKHLCWTLEDAVRIGEKQAGKTAIPAGRYPVIINYSNRFQRLMPLICNIPSFEGVRFHGGNSHHDTAGCPLVARKRYDEGWKIQGSFERELTEIIRDALDNGRVYLEVENWEYDHEFGKPLTWEAQ